MRKRSTIIAASAAAAVLVIAGAVTALNVSDNGSAAQTTVTVRL
jgi:multiple sugar transport system substrate-binding protein